ncbi:hypothetical protein I6F11_28180 [Ensifer sp. NBAIM29]|nr:hypothetical protein [Ensifer sp. NBAIM29]
MKLLEYLPFFIGCVAGAFLALFLSSIFILPEILSLVGFVLLPVIGGGLTERFWRKS